MSFEEIKIKESQENQAEKSNESVNEAQDSANKVEAFEKAQADLASAKEKDSEKKKSILEKFKNFFGEDPYKKEIKAANEFFKSLQYTAIRHSGPGGAESRNEIDFQYQLEGDEVDTFQKIIETTKQISKVDKGEEKVNLLRSKSELIQELKGKVGRRIAEKYKDKKAA